MVQVILETILLRREKTTKDKDGNPIVQLPSKTTNIEYLDLSTHETKLYDAIFRNVKKDYDSLTASGLITKNITSMLARIMTYVPLLVLIRPRRYSESCDDQASAGGVPSGPCEEFSAGSRCYCRERRRGQD